MFRDRLLGKLKIELRDEGGFTLIEMMIASSMLLFIAYAFASQSLYQAKLARSLDSRIEVADVKTSIAIALSQPEPCASTLAGKGPGDAIPAILEGTQTGGVWTMTQKYPLDTILPGRVKLTGLALVGAVPAGNVGTMTLRITTEQMKDVVGSASVNRDLPLRVTMDGAGKIAQCQAFPGQELKSVVCPNPTTECANSNDYCNNEIYPNLTSDCICLGTKTSGTSLAGFACGP